LQVVFEPPGKRKRTVTFEITPTHCNLDDSEEADILRGYLPHPKSVTSRQPVLLDAIAVCGGLLSQTFTSICVSTRFSGWKRL